MHFMAFGDSTTAGENGIDFSGDTFPEIYIPPTCGTSSLQSAARSPQFFDPSASYPQQLLNLLKGRFPGESFVMENEGNPGEPAGGSPPNGMLRLATCFTTDHPDVLLLLEGVNDIAGTYDWAPTTVQGQTIVGYLRSDVSRAISNGVSFVFVSTILPVGNCTSFNPPQPCRGADPSVPGDFVAKNAAIDQVNAIIRSGIGGATIVEGNAAFKVADPTLASLIDVDGLHPTKTGYAVLAQAWMNAVAARVPITSVRR
jgi:lysophospholipase L1-like esterase